MKKWPQEGYKWYRDACDMFDYPGLPYGKRIKALSANTDTVLDLGCGIGAASVMLSPWCGRVIALDQDENALRCLGDHVRERGIANIDIVNARWPVQTPMQADVIIALHVYGAMRSFDNLKLIFESAAKGGFIACNAPSSRHDESFAELKEALGIPPNYEKCDNGCYIMGVMEALGAHTTCKRVTYQFGQPLETPDEAIRFICWQIQGEEAMLPVIRKHVERYVKKDGAKYVIPITRHSCGVTFLK